MDSENLDLIESWRRHEFTCQLHKTYETETIKSLEWLFKLCAGSEDSKVREAFTVYRVKKEMAELLGGGR